MLRDGTQRALDDETVVPLWFDIDEQFKFRPTREFFDAALKHLAWKHRYHPVRDYLAGLRWDGTPRVDRWLVAYGGAADTAYVRAVGALVLVAAVRRVRTPGCKFDELLALESEVQGTEKSSALRTLCPDENWFSDDLPLASDSKVVIERTAGKWLIEASELLGSAREADHLKSFLSRQTDGPVRLAYARLPTEVPRQFVVIGTTNECTGYLKDTTGGRRFWPVRVMRFEIARLRADRDQLWAEAAHREALPGRAQGPVVRLPPMWLVLGACLIRPVPRGAHLPNRLDQSSRASRCIRPKLASQK